MAVAAMSRRVGGGGKTSGMVAGYARPGVEHLHKLRDVKELRTKSVEAAASSERHHAVRVALGVGFGRDLFIICYSKLCTIGTASSSRA